MYHVPNMFLPFIYLVCVSDYSDSEALGTMHRCGCTRGPNLADERDLFLELVDTRFSLVCLS